MKWSFILNGKRVTWERSDSLVAIPPSRDFKPKLKDEFFEEPRKDYAYRPEKKRSQLDREIFERAGWRFIDRAQAGAARFREVFLSESDDLLIETKLATVQLTEHCYSKRTTPERVLTEDGLKIVHKLSFAPNVFAVQILSERPLPETIDALQKKTDRYVFAEPSLLQTITGRFTPTDPDFLSQWQHARVLTNGTGGFGLNATAAWDITKGRSPERPVRVAIIDNGMNVAHPDLQGAIIGGGFFRQDGSGTGTSEFVRIGSGVPNFPLLGHGTYCLGMVGARQNNGKGGCGIAPDSDLIAIACAEDQTGTQLTLARAIEFAINPQAIDPEGNLSKGADVLSCSLKTANILESVLALAIDSAADGRDGLGVPIFWAVSNISTDLIANDRVCSLDNVIAVGSARRDGSPAGSATGPKLEFLAPGEKVFGPGLGTSSISRSGTSFATPLAAGVAALVISLHPDWTADDVRQHLRDTCDNPNGTGHDDRFGFGRLNAFKAVQPS